MASWSPPQTIAAGAPLPSAYFNIVATNETFLAQAPYASIYDSVGTSIPAGADTLVGLAGVTFLGYGWAVSGGNALVVPLTGVYQINFRISYASTASADGHFSQLFQNGNSTIYGSWVSFTATCPAPQSVGSCLLKCTAGDTLSLVAYQNSIGTLVTTNDTASTAIDAFFVGFQ